MASMAKSPHRGGMQSPSDPQKDPDKPTSPSQGEVREPPVSGEKETEEKFPRKGDLPDTAP
jgi:hypothetical protein